MLSITAKYTIAALLALGLTAAINAQARTMIRVAGETTVETDQIRLGQLATIGGDPARINRLQNISLGYAPKVGMIRTIERQQIDLAIAASGLGPDEFTLGSPTSVKITRIGQQLARSVIQDEIERTLLSKLAADGVTFKIVRCEISQTPEVPKGVVEIHVDGSAARNLLTAFTLTVEIKVDGKVVSRITASMELEAYGDVLVAARDLKANTKVNPGDVRKESRKIVRPVTDYVRDIARFKGAILTRDVASGTEIISTALAATTVVRAGDTVNIEAVSGSIKVTVKGEARSSGKIGDRIAVKNAESGVILQARVIDEGLVSVVF